MAEDLAAQSGSIFFYEVALAISCIVAAWIFIFFTSQFLPKLSKKCSYVCSFRQPYVHDIKYMHHSFVVVAVYSSGERSLYVDLKFLTEVVVKFGVLLDVPRNEARKNLRNLASCSVLTSNFDAKKNNEKDNGWFNIF